MDPILQKAFAAAKAGHEGLLAGFGIERFILYGQTIPPFSREWEERLTLTGSGQAKFSNLRSITDGSGDPIGYFQTTLTRKEIVDIITLVEQVGLLDTAPFRIEPDDMQIRMTMVLGGVLLVKHLGVRDPDRLAPLHPLMDRLQEIERNLKRSPMRSVSIQLEMPDRLETGLQRIPVSLRFRNQGREAYWIAHPRALNRGAYSERCALHYGHRPSGPAEVEIIEAPMLPEQETGMGMIWMPPGGQQESRLFVDANFHKPGVFIARAVFSSYDGEDLIGGVPRMRGCVFSQEISIQAGV